MQTRRLLVARRLSAVIVSAVIRWAVIPGAVMLCAGDLRAVQGQEVAIRNITDVDGETTDTIEGFGLVAGLNKSGSKDPTTRLAYLNFLDSLGFPSDPLLRAQNGGNTKTDNLSLVALSAQLKPTHHEGSRITVSVAAVGDTKSLLGGLLLRAPLLGVDGQVYAEASGKIQVGGFAANGAAASVQQNVPTTGEAQGTVLVPVPNCLFRSPEKITLRLRDPNSTTAVRISDAINMRFPEAARTVNAATVEVKIPFPYQTDPIRFHSQIQDLRIVPNIKARIVINEDTGTIIIGDAVRLSRVAVTHANLQIVAGENPQVSQPAPMSRGETVVVPRTDLAVTDEDGQLRLLENTATVGDLVDALNSLGVTPRDLSSILRTLQRQGSLHAELEFN